MKTISQSVVAFALSVVTIASADPRPLPLPIMFKVSSDDVRMLPWKKTCTLYGALMTLRFNTEYPRSVTLIRNGERTKYKRSDILRGQVPNPELQPGDVIEFPPTFTW